MAKLKTSEVIIPNTTLPLPKLTWLIDPFNKLLHGLMSERSPHAVLVTGSAGIGKHVLVNHAIARLFCLDKHTQYGCGICKSCIWLKNGTHPDFLLIQPEVAEKPIKVDQIRLLNDFFQTTAQNTHKIALIVDAHLMNVNAANSILKTLEEPPGNGLIFLITPHPQKLPITIRSRMQNMVIPCPNHEDALSFLHATQKLSTNAPIVSKDACSEVLHLAHNAPLLGLQWITEGIFETQKKLIDVFIGSLRMPHQIADAADLLAKESHLSIDLLCTWINDALRLKINADADIRYLSYRSTLLELHKPHSILMLSTQYEALLLINGRLDTQIRVDWQLESWLMAFMNKY